MFVITKRKQTRNRSSSHFLHVRLHPSVASVLLEASNLVSKIHLLVSESCDLISACTGGFTGVAVAKVEVVNEGLVRLDLNLNVINFFLSSLLLSLETLLGFESHADLGKLEDEFEVGKDGVVRRGCRHVHNGQQKLAPLTFKILVHGLSNFTEPDLLED